MYLRTVYLSPCCKAECVPVKDKLASRHIMRCGKCKNLVSKKGCEKQHWPAD